MPNEAEYDATDPYDSTIDAFRAGYAQAQADAEPGRLTADDLRQMSAEEIAAEMRSNKANVDRALEEG